jgi:hypothetical protein
MGTFSFAITCLLFYVCSGTNHNNVHTSISCITCMYIWTYIPCWKIKYKLMSYKILGMIILSQYHHFFKVVTWWWRRWWKCDVVIGGGDQNFKYLHLANFYSNCFFSYLEINLLVALIKNNRSILILVKENLETLWLLFWLGFFSYTYFDLDL